MSYMAENTNLGLAVGLDIAWPANGKVMRIAGKAFAFVAYSCIGAKAKPV